MKSAAMALGGAPAGGERGCRVGGGGRGYNGLDPQLTATSFRALAPSCKANADASTRDPPRLETAVA